MSSSNFVRWGGLVAMGSGVLWMVVFALFALRPSGPGVTPPYRNFKGLVQDQAASWGMDRCS